MGSALLDGERTRHNFLSDAAFNYANEKVAEKLTNRDLTIDEYRLFNNMLSSMPMCFNLFSDFRQGVRDKDPAATRVLAAMFSELPIAAVELVEVEKVPTPTVEYTGDKTAFDAAISFRDAQGRAGLAAIETKYTDKLGGNVASKPQRAFALADEISLLTSEGRAWYTLCKGFDQVTRNLLLTLAYARKHGLPHSINYVLGPADDYETLSAIAALQARLTEGYRNRIVWLPLEQAIERGLKVADPFFAGHLRRFQQRYLDFSQISHLM